MFLALSITYTRPLLAALNAKLGRVRLNSPDFSNRTKSASSIDGAISIVPGFGNRILIDYFLATNYTDFTELYFLSCTYFLRVSPCLKSLC